MKAGRHHWLYARETVFALAVLALTFLNFGHLSVSASGSLQVTPDVWCGDPMTPGGASHAPCHACRVDGAALPPPPAEAIPVAFATHAVAYARIAAPLAPATALATAQPRGPPALV